MKISNSKKELARIIKENGGWREGAEFAAQDSVKDSCPCRICFYSNKPNLKTGARRWFDGNNGIVGGAEGCIHGVNAISNWHQTRLSRDEYFHLYPVAEAAPEPVVEAKPTIEQLAADYRNAKDYADRKQQEADAAKADAEAKLAELVAAGKAHGLVLSVTDAGPEMVITDWRDLQLGDVIKAVPFNDERDTKFRGGWASMNLGKEFAVFLLSENGISIDSSNPLNPQEETDRGLAFSFIRRP